MPKLPGEGPFDEAPTKEKVGKNLGGEESPLHRLSDEDRAKFAALQDVGETPTQPNIEVTDGIGSVEPPAVEEVRPIEPSPKRRVQSREGSVWEKARRPSLPNASKIPPADTGGMLALKEGSGEERRYAPTAVVRESANRLPFDDRKTMMQTVPEGVRKEVTEEEFGSYDKADRIITVPADETTAPAPVPESRPQASNVVMDVFRALRKKLPF